MKSILEQVKFDDKGLIPTIAQDANTNEVLMFAFMNREALVKTIETGKAHYWSRSRNQLWLKGETSGNYQLVKSISIDCDNDALLLKIEQKNAACHTGNYSCFFKEVTDADIKETSTPLFNPDEFYKNDASVLQDLYNLIIDRKLNPLEKSYTNYLFEKGIDKILKKVGEEAAEVIIAAKNNSKDEIRYESSDLIYHLLVLLVDRGVTLQEIYTELKGREKK